MRPSSSHMTKFLTVITIYHNLLTTLSFLFYITAMRVEKWGKAVGVGNEIVLGKSAVESVSCTYVLHLLELFSVLYICRG